MANFFSINFNVSSAQPANLTVTLDVRDGTAGTLTAAPADEIGYRFAPHAVTVEANVSDSPVSAFSHDNYDATFHRIYYIHDFGEPGVTFSVPSLVLPDWLNRNKGIGKYCTHVYRTPGTYTWTVYAYDDLGNFGMASTQITIKDPENETDGFTADQTVIVAPDGVFTGAPPADALNQLTTIQDGLLRLSAISSGKRKVRILLKRGHSYEVNTEWQQRSTPDAHVFGDWGAPTDARPLVTSTPTLLSGSHLFRAGQDGNDRQFKMYNWQFDLGWDAATEIQDPTSGGHTAMISGDNWVDFQLDNIAATGYQVFGGPVSSAFVGSRCTYHEIDCTNFRDFLTLTGPGNYDFAAVGCSIVQSANALTGGENRNGSLHNKQHARNAHHGIRGNSPGMEIRNSDFYGRHGWMIQYGWFDQAMMRLNSQGGTVDTNRYIVANNRIESQIWMVDATGLKSPPQNFLIDSNAMSSSPLAERCITVGITGVTIRNNILVNGSSPRKNKSAGLITWTDGDMIVGSPDVEIRIYNNTLVDLSDTADIQSGHDFIRDFGSLPLFSEWNNVKYAPNFDTPIVSDGPLDLTSIGWENRYTVGIARGWERTPSTTLAADILADQSIFVPYWADHYGNTLTQAAFAGTQGRNKVEINSTTLYHQSAGLAEFSFDPTGITITNRSGVTWPAGANFVVHVDRGTTHMERDPTFINAPGMTARYSVLAGAGGYQSATEHAPFYDILGNLRPGTEHPDAPAGTPSKGALEPA